MRSNESILVRRFTADDADAFHSAVRASVVELSSWMPWCHPGYSLEEARQWMAFCESAWASRSEFPLGVFDAATGRVVGGTGFNQINTIHRIANLGYWVATPFTCQGVARAAVRLAADIGFAELGFTRQEIVVLTDNLASQRVARAVGARLECTARNRLHFQGGPRPALVYSLTSQDLPPAAP